MKMKQFFYLLIFCGVTFTLTACEFDFREKAKGSIEEVFVVMDSAKWNSQTAEAIRNVYGKYVRTLPQPEPFYRLTFTSFNTNSQLERLKSYKNVIFAAPIDEESSVGQVVRGLLDENVEQNVRSGDSFAFPIKDQWYRDQYAIVLTSYSDSALAAKIENSERSLVSDIFKREMKRWTAEVYEKMEQTQYSDSLWNKYGWKIRIQHDYIKNLDTLNFVTFRRPLPRNDRWIWAWWKDGVDDIQFLDDEWINATRDSLMEKYIRGTRDSSYVTTEYRRPVETNTFEQGRILVYETLGTWRMTHDAMGGPFVNFTYYDPATRRLFMVEFSQFAPGINKRRFVRQFRAMGRTFESDSTWTPDRYPDIQQEEPDVAS